MLKNEQRQKRVLNNYTISNVVPDNIHSIYQQLFNSFKGYDSTYTFFKPRKSHRVTKTNSN